MFKAKSKIGSLKDFIGWIFAIAMLVIAIFYFNRSTLQRDTQELSTSDPGQIKLLPIHDTFVASNFPDASFGQAGALVASNGDTVRGDFEFYLKFDLSAAKRALDESFGREKWKLRGISLVMHPASANNPIFPRPTSTGSVYVDFFQNDRWIEGSGNPRRPGNDGVNWKDRTKLRNEGDRRVGKIANDRCVFSDFGEVQSSIESGRAINFHVTAEKNSAAMYHSSNFGSDAERPTLNIDAVTK